jgi:hypothetical protein
MKLKVYYSPQLPSLFNLTNPVYTVFLNLTSVSWQLNAPAASLAAREPKYALEIRED